MSNSAPVSILELDQAIWQRNRVHGWRWPVGATASLANATGSSSARIWRRRVTLLIEAVREAP